MHAPLRLTLVSPSLGAGGAERVVQGLAAGFIDAGHEVSVVTTTSRADFYELHPEACRTALDLSGVAPGSGRSLRRLPSAAFRLRSMIDELRSAIDQTEPDLVVTFMEDINVLGLLAAARRHPVVVTEHNNPTLHTTPRMWRGLRRVVYGRAACLVSVGEGVDRAFAWVPHEKRRVINNPLPFDPRGDDGSVPEPPSSPSIAAMGRLTHQKGFDLLIDAFGRVAASHPEWSLDIIGDGPDRERLDAHIANAGLADRVRLLGQRRDPLGHLRRAEFFALSSRWEGFGNAVAEALSVGLPVVSFDCPSGPAEIIEDGRTGVLVGPEDVDAFAAALDAMMRDHSRRRRMARAAPGSVAYLRRDRIVAAWEEQVFPLVRSSCVRSTVEVGRS